MIKRIDIAAYLAGEQCPLLDVRTPAEFEKGHIPGAFNLPLFTNEERVEVGTIYKQISPEKALLRGLDFVGPKMRKLVEEAQKVAPDRKVAVHCWRGGQRSGSLAWLLGMAGFDVQIIKGGYKAYRKHIYAYFEKLDIPMIVIGGKTGSGKTEVLHALEEKGEQILDLEALANHKGSSFGALGEAPQPSVEHFENILFETLQSLDVSRTTWVENESKSIGRVYLPKGIWSCMQKAPLIDLQVPLDHRINRLVGEYATFPVGILKEAFVRIKKRLGGQHLKAALDALEDNDFERATDIALKYYDKAYQHHTFSKREENAGPIWVQEVESDRAEIIADQIMLLKKKH